MEVCIDLALTLYAADEFRRAADVLDALLPDLEQRDGAANPAVLQFRHMAGVSHAEAGDPWAALEHLTAFLERAEPYDPLVIEARYQRGLMLHAVGRTDEGIAELSGLRPLLVEHYGADSIHVRSLDRRIDQLRRLA